MSRLLLQCALGGWLLLWLLHPAAALAQTTSDPLVFSYFRNNGEDGLYLAASDDGLNFRALNNDRPLLAPSVGENKLMRDPSIAVGPDGTFHMVWTTSWQGKTLGYASSKDLRTWSPQRVIPVQLEGEVLNSWAPELFFDSTSREFVIVWASTIRGRFPETAGKGGKEYNHRLYSIRTADFATFTNPELFYDPGFQVIDGALFRHNNRYWMVAKNETLLPAAKYLFLTSAASLKGPWTAPTASISGAEWAEGPAPIRINDAWYIYFDKYRDHRYGVIRSKDLKQWEDLSAQLHMPKGIRHGTMFRAPRGVVAALESSPTQLEAVIDTELGEIRFEFDPEKAPKHVEHFLKLAREGYYNGSAFHRAIPGGIIQGGDPLLKDPKTPKNLWGTGGLNLLPSEFSDRKHERGTVSTVRIPDKPNSDGAQFFICASPQPPLDGQFSVFGRVTEGMEIVDKISQLPAGENAFLDTPLRIRSLTIEGRKVEPFLDAAVEQLRRTVSLKTTVGTLKLRMEPDWAPEHVRNFLKLAATGWLNGTAFHRVSKGFVVQGGMGHTRASGATHAADRWVRTIKGEFRQDLKHTRGLVSMARNEDPDSASTSFFLLLADAPHLDGKYSLFATVIEGLEVLEAFEKEEVDGETPKRRLEIVSATVDPR
jgi:cyclophilin family peptidyl-prolyl cis-trans isomerase